MLPKSAACSRISLLGFDTKDPARPSILRRRGIPYGFCSRSALDLLRGPQTVFLTVGLTRLREELEGQTEARQFALATLVLDLVCGDLAAVADAHEEAASGDARRLGNR